MRARPVIPRPRPAISASRAARRLGSKDSGKLMLAIPLTTEIAGDWEHAQTCRRDRDWPCRDARRFRSAVCGVPSRVKGNATETVWRPLPDSPRRHHDRSFPNRLAWRILNGE
jgi:hypothetical protein